MAKAMTIAGMAISGLLALAFALDLALGIPFSGANMMMDAGFFVASLCVAYASWNAFRELR